MNDAGPASDDELVRLYERLPVTADADWWAGLVERAPDGSVLYLGCGTGRLAITLADAGRTLVGVDVDQRMLDAFGARLERASAEAAERVRLVRSPAEELDLGERYGLVVLPSNLLNGIVDPTARLAAVRAAAAHCRSDGLVVLQVLNPYWASQATEDARGQLEPTAGGRPVDVVIDRMQFDPWEQRQQARIRYRFEDGEELDDHLDAVVLFPRELRALVFQSGLEIVEQWGARPGKDPLDRDGGTWHLVCRPG